MSEFESEEFGMVMPFVAVASKGGPYDDEAYAAGFEMGQLCAELASSPPNHDMPILRTANAHQADLIAMQHGYMAKVEASEDWPEWAHAVFTRSEETGDTP